VRKVYGQYWMTKHGHRKLAGVLLGFALGKPRHKEGALMHLINCRPNCTCRGQKPAPVTFLERILPVIDRHLQRLSL
jgi:hypothetical protein